MQQNSARFSVLESWRGVAAVFVVLYHSMFYGHSFVLSFVRNAYLFVDFFFVLSGFVITHAYMSRLTTRDSYVAFVVKRFGRVWPLHAVVLGLYFIAELGKYAVVTHSHVVVEYPPFTGGLSFSKLVANIFLVHCLGFFNQLSWNVPSWSISTEFYTYIVFALMVALLGKGVRLVVASIALCIVAAIVILTHSHRLQVMGTTYDYGFIRCLYGFFVGHLVYRLYQRCSNTRIPAVALLEVSAVIAVAWFVSTYGVGPWSVAAPLIFGPVILLFALESGPISQALRLKPFRKLGAWSYSIYMTHSFIGIMLIQRGAHAIEVAFGVPVFQKIAIAGEHDVLRTSLPHSLYWMDLLNLVYLGSVVAASCWTYSHIEEPARKYFNRLADRWSQRRQFGESKRTSWRSTTLPAATEEEQAKLGTTAQAPE